MSSAAGTAHPLPAKEIIISLFLVPVSIFNATLPHIHLFILFIEQRRRWKPSLNSSVSPLIFTAFDSLRVEHLQNAALSRYRGQSNRYEQIELILRSMI